MTTEEKLDALIDAVSCFTNVMMTTMQGVAAIVRANNESSDEQTYEIDGKKMTLTEYQNMITKMQLDAQYEEAKAQQEALYEAILGVLISQESLSWRNLLRGYRRPSV